MTIHPPLIRPTVLLRLEAAAALAVAAGLYGAHGGGWALFALLLLAPDLSALGYLAGSATGAAWYNAAHTYLVPAALGAVGLTTGHAQLPLLALIWAAHIGLDRLLGYGLKYPDGFKRTHLSDVSTADTEGRPRIANAHSVIGER